MTLTMEGAMIEIVVMFLFVMPLTVLLIGVVILALIWLYDRYIE